MAGGDGMVHSSWDFPFNKMALVVIVPEHQGKKPGIRSYDEKIPDR